MDHIDYQVVTVKREAFFEKHFFCECCSLELADSF